MWSWGLAAHVLRVSLQALPCAEARRGARAVAAAPGATGKKNALPPYPCCPGPWPTAPAVESVRLYISISVRAVSACEYREPPTSCEVGPYKQATPPCEVNRPRASHHSNGCLVVCLGGSAASHVEGAAYSGYASLLLACGHCQYLSLSPLNAHPTGTRIRHGMCCILLL